jgi:DNA-binding MarR family transcriptional regulator
MKKLAKFKPCGHLKTTTTGKFLFFILKTISDEYGVVTIRHRLISETLGISRSAVSKNLRRLEDIGAICIIPGLGSTPVRPSLHQSKEGA